MLVSAAGRSTLGATPRSERGSCVCVEGGGVRQLVLLDGLSRREVARQLGISRDTVSKMCRYSAPPGYVRTKPVSLPKLGPLIGVIDAILDADETAAVKQGHTAKRIWRRHCDEHRFAGGYTTVNTTCAESGPSPARPCPDRLRRSGWRHQRPAVNAESIPHVSARTRTRFS
jgi:hypothetical protein